MLAQAMFHRLRYVVVLVSSMALFNASCLSAYSQQRPDADLLTKPQLEQLASPIALYPDPLLTQILMAATYPLDVVEAARWRKSNPGLKGAALERALQSKTWDDSVKSLAAIPDVLQMLNDQLEWTQQIGEAFLAQRDDLFAAIQDLRRRAQSAGNLKTTPQQRVVQQDSYIEIEPVDADQFYVPYYEPQVYGAWPYADYPTYDWYPRRHRSGSLYWYGAAILVGTALWATWDWNRRRVNVDTRRFNRFTHTTNGKPTWEHDPAHRRGAPYKNPALASKFQSVRGTAPDRSGPQTKGAPNIARTPKGPLQPETKNNRRSRTPIIQKGPENKSARTIERKNVPATKPARERSRATTGRTTPSPAVRNRQAPTERARPQVRQARPQNRPAIQQRTPSAPRQTARPPQAARQAPRAAPPAPRPAPRPAPPAARAQQPKKPPPPN